MRGRRNTALLAGVAAAALALAGPRSSRPTLEVVSSAPRPAEVAMAAHAEADAADAPPGPCSGLAPRRLASGTKLPWPATLRTTCGSFLVQRNGAVVSLPQPLQPVHSYKVPTGPAAWAEVVGGRVVFESRGETIWSSAGSSFDEQDLGSAVAGPGWVAFSKYVSSGESELYVSALDGSEQKVAVNEDPVAVAADGMLVVSRWRSDGSYPDLLAVRPDGSLVRTLALRVPSSLQDTTSATVLYYDIGYLWRTDGVRSWQLARFHDLGFGRIVNLNVLADGRMMLTGPARVALLRPDGTVVSVASSTPIPKGGWGFISVWEDQSIDPRAGDLVFVATTWKDASMGGGSGWEGVYSLAPGESAPRLLFGKRLSIAVCAHSASLSWHGRWLLYAACEGRVVAIDTTGRHSPIDLSLVARSLPIPPDERGYGLWDVQWAPFGSLGRQAQV